MLPIGGKIAVSLIEIHVHRCKPGADLPLLLRNSVMKAILYEAFSQPPKLVTLPDPAPSPMASWSGWRRRACAEADWHGWGGA